MELIENALIFVSSSSCVSMCMESYLPDDGVDEERVPTTFTSKNADLCDDAVRLPQATGVKPQAYTLESIWMQTKNVNRIVTTIQSQAIKDQFWSSIRLSRLFPLTPRIVNGCSKNVFRSNYKAVTKS